MKISRLLADTWRGPNPVTAFREGTCTGCAENSIRLRSSFRDLLVPSGLHFQRRGNVCPLARITACILSTRLEVKCCTSGEQCAVEMVSDSASTITSKDSRRSLRPVSTEEDHGYGSRIAMHVSRLPTPERGHCWKRWLSEICVLNILGQVSNLIDG